MSILNNRKVMLIALSSAIITMTGCSAKSNRSQIAVAPLGMSGVSDDGMNYNGGALVANSSDVIDAASQLQGVVYFAFDSSDLTDQAVAVLDQHVTLLGSSEQASVLVTGHTDPRGSREYNMALGERRAQAVRDYLSAQGVNASNVEIVSRGEEEVTGDHAQDRRAVLSY